MAKKPSFAESCCKNLVPSAWFDEFPLWRNVTITQSIFEKICGISFTSHFVDLDQITLWHQKSKLSVTVTQFKISFISDETTQHANMTLGQKKSEELVSSIAKHIKTLLEESKK